MDFGGLLKEAWERFVAELVPLVLFALLGSLLCLTIILIPTVLAGWVRGILAYLRDGDVPAFDELWSFDDFLPVTLMLLLAFAGVTIGYMLLFVPGVILSTWWLYTLYFLVDRHLGIIEAFGASKDAVTRTGFFDHLVVLLIVWVLAAVGGLLWLGTIFTTPFSLVFLTLVYLELPPSDRSDEEASLAR